MLDGESALDGFKRIINKFSEKHYQQLKSYIAEDINNSEDVKASLVSVAKEYGVKDENSMPVLYPIVPNVFQDDLKKLGVTIPTAND